MSSKLVGPWGLAIRQLDPHSGTWAVVGTGVRVGRRHVLTALHVVSDGEPGAWKPNQPDQFRVFDESIKVEDFARHEVPDLDVVLLRLSADPGGDCVVVHEGDWDSGHITVTGWPMVSKKEPSKDRWNLSGTAPRYSAEGRWLVTIQAVPNQSAGLSGAGVELGGKLVGLVSYKPGGWSANGIVGVPVHLFRDWLRHQLQAEQREACSIVAKECVGRLRALGRVRDFLHVLRVASSTEAEEDTRLLGKVEALTDQVAAQLWNRVDLKLKQEKVPQADRWKCCDVLLTLLPVLPYELAADPLVGCNAFSYSLATPGLAQVGSQFARWDNTIARLSPVGDTSLSLPRTVSVPAATEAPLFQNRDQVLSAIYPCVRQVVESTDCIAADLKGHTVAPRALPTESEWDNLNRICKRRASTDDDEIRSRPSLLFDLGVLRDQEVLSQLGEGGIAELGRKLSHLRVIRYKRTSGQDGSDQLSEVLAELLGRLVRDAPSR